MIENEAIIFCFVDKSKTMYRDMVANFGMGAEGDW